MSSESERFLRERTLSELSDPSPTEVEALLSGEVSAAPVMDQLPTRILEAKAGRAPDERKTEPFEPRR